MNKQRKVLISSVAAITVAIPALFFLSVMMPVGNQVHTLVAEITDEELIANVDMIVQGTASHSEPIELFYGSDSKTPKIYTKWFIETDTIYKGESNSKFVEALMPGGEKNGFTTLIDHAPHIEDGDQVILFLNKDPESVFGDNYVIAGPAIGTYVIHNDIATNENPEKAILETELISKIQTNLGKD